jgi:allophanate hydrolase
MLSEASPLGAIQVPGSGLPIVLMADRQTTGGYPKIATVITADVSQAAQLKPGDRVDFALVTLDEAIEALRGLEASLGRGVVPTEALRSMDGWKRVKS